MPFINIDDYKPIELAPGAKARTPYGENIMLSFLELEEGSVIPMHHHHHEQAGMLLKGKMELTIGGRTRRYGPGDSYHIPAGVTHSAKFLSHFRAIDVFADVDRYKLRAS